ncbi:MAG: LptF/LptG family permease [Candidatus Gastranaerophilales bacterium]|nr:LptF/LptG family permease [Candidatus Gastranaerophilales bacterium]
MDKLKIIDKYIGKQLLETFILGIVIFTSLMFASDTFITLVKQVATYGIQFKIAFLIVILKLPSILVLTIPMGVLLSTVLTYNKLGLNSEITVMRACGISIARLARPAVIFGATTCLLCFILNEAIVPIANAQSKGLTLWALNQKNIPDGKKNFSIKELNDKHQLKRLFYIREYSKKKMDGITVLDLSKKNTIQVIQSRHGYTTPEYWVFKKGVMYTISTKGNSLNTTVFGQWKLYNNISFLDKLKKHKSQELNFINLIRYINYQKNQSNNTSALKIDLQEKFSIPLMTLAFVLIGIPIAITPPRARFNRGFLCSIFIIFCYYIIMAFSRSLGESGVIFPSLSAWIPVIVISAVGGYLFYIKAYKV